MPKTEKNHRSIGDRLNYSYIRSIKRWMFCPACQEGKMVINRKSSTWKCEGCGYQLSADEFEDDCMFWFCDECNTYLNNQEGFIKEASKHMCTNCGYENDTTFNKIKGICFDCGKVIPDADSTLCADCKQVRKQKAKDRFIAVGKFVGAAAAVLGVAYLASQATGDDDEGELNYSGRWMRSATDYELDTEREKVKMAYCSAGDDFDSACRLQNLLWRFDEEMSKRAWAGEEPRGPGFHREHGWYLPNDD